MKKGKKKRRARVVAVDALKATADASEDEEPQVNVALSVESRNVKQNSKQQLPPKEPTTQIADDVSHDLDHFISNAREQTKQDLKPASSNYTVNVDQDEEEENEKVSDTKVTTVVGSPVKISLETPRELEVKEGNGKIEAEANSSGLQSAIALDREREVSKEREVDRETVVDKERKSEEVKEVLLEQEEQSVGDGKRKSSSADESNSKSIDAREARRQEEERIRRENEAFRAEIEALDSADDDDLNNDIIPRVVSEALKKNDADNAGRIQLAPEMRGPIRRDRNSDVDGEDDDALLGEVNLDDLDMEGLSLAHSEEEDGHSRPWVDHELQQEDQGDRKLKITRVEVPIMARARGLSLGEESPDELADPHYDHDQQPRDSEEQKAVMQEPIVVIQNAPNKPRRTPKQGKGAVPSIGSGSSVAAQSQPDPEEMKGTIYTEDSGVVPVRVFGDYFDLDPEHEPSGEKGEENLNSNSSSTQPRTRTGTHVKLHFNVIERVPDRELWQRQKSRCIQCGTGLPYSYLFPRAGPRFCYYTGHYYCHKCCVGERRPIPGRIIFNQDITPYRVCNVAQVFLDMVWKQPTLCVGSINPALYQVSKALRYVSAVRIQLRHLLPFIWTCPKKESVMSVMGSRAYMMGEPPDERDLTMLPPRNDENKHGRASDDDDDDGDGDRPGSLNTNQGVHNHRGLNHSGSDIVFTSSSSSNNNNNNKSIPRSTTYIGTASPNKPNNNNNNNAINGDTYNNNDSAPTSSSSSSSSSYAHSHGSTHTKAHPRPHQVHSHKTCDLYSLEDLVGILDGEFCIWLNKVVRQLSAHVVDGSCEICSAKGFICEMAGCKDHSPIYPFQLHKVVQCTGCKSFFHRTCFLPQVCPKCARMTRRQQKQQNRSRNLYSGLHNS